MTEHKRLLKLAFKYFNKMEAVHDKTGLSKKRWQYLYGKYCLIMELLCDLGEVRYRRAN